MEKSVSVFPTGDFNKNFADYFIGNSYLFRLSQDLVAVNNITFEPRCRNNWHIHQADQGGGQILIVTAGEGYYQEWGQEVRQLAPGDVVNIHPGVKHWHGAKTNTWFQHISIEVPGENRSTQWCEPVTDEVYDNLPK